MADCSVVGLQESCYPHGAREVPSTEKLTTEVNDLVKKDLSEYQSIFVFVLTHGSYDRIWDVEGSNPDSVNTDNELNKNLKACWKETSKQLKGSAINGKANNRNLSEYQSIFVFVLTHGSYNRIWDVEGQRIKQEFKGMLEGDFETIKGKCHQRKS
ncbi:hypothetical protein DAPPUDRAFT_233550 [Daphnia pulex]|uniref:Uncharacterized protein n=1 Tax=Daphnia pulex TaxID=6669 RepID=E9FV38_DAPPU|nr:hypothetical protein DAPPUDRAFT_233550 [Daphnia pulex]|eukprot:EFX88489.1 hypothetical protein DAPPUDRAFT_233550 [Daphnia pulex]